MEIQVSPVPFALKWGMLLGLSEILVHLCFYLMGKPITPITSWIYAVLLIGFFILGIQVYRDRYLGGFISWRQGFIMVLIMGLFGALIYMMYYTIVVSLDRQAFIDAGIEEATQSIETLKKYVTDEKTLEQIDDGLDKSIDEFQTMSPLSFGFGQYVKSCLVIIPIALLVPVFMKKRDPDTLV